MSAATKKRRAVARPAAVLWDMDGTIVDTEPYWIECEYELVAEFGLRELLFNPPKSYPPSEFDVRIPGGPWVRRLRRRLHFFRHSIVMLSTDYLTYGCTLPMGSAGRQTHSFNIIYG